ncbi:MAG TPA: hypothetical protein VI564_03725 [Candidatus Nanoarchaeia archaeon]|nr:hypothetical protein [Candidatus Nanoarchaeia archaeon]
MGKILYGLDLSKKITPIMVRDAIIECFTQAHKEILDTMDEFAEWKSEEEREDFKKMEAEYVVKYAFDNASANFENPTKEDLLKATKELAKYSCNFRKRDIIDKHFNEIKSILEKCE